MKVFLNDPPLYRQTDDAKYLPIQELFDCDFITLHTPLTFEGIDKTFHLADGNFFESLKQGCIFINASRGGIVDSEALKSAMQSGRLRAVVLDVWENEPRIDTTLLGMVDVGTPHIAGYSLDGKIAGLIMIYKSVCEYFGTEPKFGAADFLPAPEVKKIEITKDTKNEQDTLSQIVRKVYSIDRDDAMLRQVIDEPEENRGKFFDKLRKNYPVRREFQNTEVIVEKSNLAEKLRGIGFIVVTK